jgi:hypothetical protein
MGRAEPVAESAPEAAGVIATVSRHGLWWCEWAEVLLYVASVGVSRLLNVFTETNVRIRDTT